MIDMNKRYNLDARKLSIWDYFLLVEDMIKQNKPK